MMVYGIPACSSSLACNVSLLSDYADKTALAATQWPWSGERSGFAKCLLSLKKKKKIFFLKPFSWPVSQLFHTNSCCGRAAGALCCSLETGRRAGEWSEMQKYLRPLLPPGTGHCRATALCSASSLAHTHGRTLGKSLGIPAPQYLDFLHCETESSMVTQAGEDLSHMWSVLRECV